MVLNDHKVLVIDAGRIIGSYYLSVRAIESYVKTNIPETSDILTVADELGMNAKKESKMYIYSTNFP